MKCNPTDLQEKNPCQYSGTMVIYKLIFTENKLLKDFNAVILSGFCTADWNLLLLVTLHSQLPISEVILADIVFNVEIPCCKNYCSRLECFFFKIHQDNISFHFTFSLSSLIIRAEQYVSMTRQCSCDIKWQQEAYAYLGNIPNWIFSNIMPQ